MGTIYQPNIIKESNIIIDFLTDMGFFEDFEIENKEFAIDYICGKLTDKFIEGRLDSDEPPFTDEEMDKMLNEIIIGSTLYELQKNGIVDSIEDENNEERYFLTEKGKNIASKINLEQKE
jgi:Fe2+ or Zn2+ uptake regulation protein